MLNAVITGKDKSGERKTFKAEEFDRPLTWESFKGYPINFQRLYIRTLQDRFNVTQQKLSDMLGVHYSTFSRYCTDPLKVVFKSGNRMTNEQKAEFDKFCESLEKKREEIAKKGDGAIGPGYKGQIRVAEEMNAAERGEKQAPVIPVQFDKNQDPKSNPKQDRANSNPKTNIRKVVLNFDGEIYLDSVINTMRAVIQDGVEATLSITCEFE